MTLVAMLLLLTACCLRAMQRPEPSPAMMAAAAITGLGAIAVSAPPPTALLQASAYAVLLVALHAGRRATTVVSATALAILSTALALAVPVLAVRAASLWDAPAGMIVHAVTITVAALAAGFGLVATRDPSLVSFTAVGAAALPRDLAAVAVPWAALGLLVLLSWRRARPDTTHLPHHPRS